MDVGRPVGRASVSRSRDGRRSIGAGRPAPVTPVRAGGSLAGKLSSDASSTRLPRSSCRSKISSPPSLAGDLCTIRAGGASVLRSFIVRQPATAWVLIPTRRAYGWVLLLRHLVMRSAARKGTWRSATLRGRFIARRELCAKQFAAPARNSLPEVEVDPVWWSPSRCPLVRGGPEASPGEASRRGLCRRGRATSRCAAVFGSRG